jgi:hypothetical protein
MTAKKSMCLSEEAKEPTLCWADSGLPLPGFIADYSRVSFVYCLTRFHLGGFLPVSVQFLVRAGLSLCEQICLAIAGQRFSLVFPAVPRRNASFLPLLLF